MSALDSFTPSLDSDPSEFLAGPGLRVLFFTGLPKRSSEAHDVGVALREIMRVYAVPAVTIAPESEAALQAQFRVVVLPSLVLMLDQHVLEVIPGVRDWRDYERAFESYLGAPVKLKETE